MIIDILLSSSPRDSAKNYSQDVLDKAAKLCGPGYVGWFGVPCRECCKAVHTVKLHNGRKPTARRKRK